jgi:signal peptidase
MIQTLFHHRKPISNIMNGLGMTILFSIILLSGSIMVLSVMGYKPMAVLSGSMEPNYHVGALVFVNTNIKAQDVRVGDVITFEMGESVVTHRVMDVAKEGNFFTTKGDANENEDGFPVPFTSLIGQAWLHIPRIGRILLNLGTKSGIAIGLIVSSILIALFVIPVLLEPDEQEGRRAPVKKRGQARLRRNSF